MTPRAKVVLVLLIFVALLVVAGFITADYARAATPVPPVPDPTAADAFGVYGFAFIVLALVIYHLIIGVYRASQVVGRAVEWVWSRPSADALALQAALDEDTSRYDVLADFDRNVDPHINERLIRKAAYDAGTSVMWTAQRELANDDLIGNVIDLWGRTSKP